MPIKISKQPQSSLPIHTSSLMPDLRIMSLTKHNNNLCLTMLNVPRPYFLSYQYATLNITDRPMQVKILMCTHYIDVVYALHLTMQLWFCCYRGGTGHGYIYSFLTQKFYQRLNKLEIEQKDMKKNRKDYHHAEVLRKHKSRNCLKRMQGIKKKMNRNYSLYFISKYRGKGV